MDGAKGEDYFDWDFKVVLNGKRMSSILKGLIKMIGFSIVEESDDTIYLKNKK